MELPQLPGDNFFHSAELFHIYEQTPRHSPMMVVARNADGTMAGCMLAVVRRRAMWLPPFFSWHCRVMGEGSYALESPYREQLFTRMMTELMRNMPIRVAYTEMSHFSTKMFGYKALSLKGFFPVNWLNIHNSLHSKSPEERISQRHLERVLRIQKKGVTMREVTTDDDLHDFVHLLKAHNFFKPKRFIPSEQFFRLAKDNPNIHLLLTTYHNNVIGCCAYALSQGNAYLWFAAYRRKSFVKLHPADMTIWGAIKRAYDEGCDHFCFLDVGLPYRKNKLRDFILGFGGKQVSSLRWFRFRYSFINRILSRIFSL